MVDVNVAMDVTDSSHGYSLGLDTAHPSAIDHPHRLLLIAA